MRLRALFFITAIIAVFMMLPALSWGATELSLEAWETQSGSSCPWVYTWNGSKYVEDNDIYSVARTQSGEYTDYYVLQKPLVANNGTYDLEVREMTSETSWTDYVGLFAVDHAADVAIGTNEKGDVFAYRPASLIAPIAAIANSSTNVTGLLSVMDGNGFGAYSDDFVEVDFGNVDVSQGARLIITVKGFLEGTGTDKPFVGPPAIVVQTLTGSGWLEVGRLRPRNGWSSGVFDLTPYLPDVNGSRKVRLYSISHGVRYHEIDFAALSTGAQPPISLSALPLADASFQGNNVLGVLNSADGNYLQMTEGDKFSLSFGATPLNMPNRDFIFVSKGYYIPSNTYYIYTWNGSAWVQRYSYNFPGSDYTRTFDLSAYLPDPDGRYRVRILQRRGSSYTNSPAGIDFVGLQLNGATLALITATDLVTSNSILSLVNASDDVRFDYIGNVGDRWTEYEWDPPLLAAPTLNEWGMIIFMVLAAAGAVFSLKRQSQ